MSAAYVLFVFAALLLMVLASLYDELRLVSCGSNQSLRSAAASPERVVEQTPPSPEHVVEPAPKNASIHFVTYGSGRFFYKSRLRLEREARNARWFSVVRGYGLSDLSHEFRETHVDLLKREKGGGFWVWKPEIVRMHLEQHMRPNDVLVYADAGCSLNVNPTSTARLMQYVDMARRAPSGVVAISLAKHSDTQYSKRDAVFAVTGRTQVDGPQLQSTVFLVRKCDLAMAVVAHWRLAASNARWLGDDASILKEHAEFRGHRHDQSLFSLVLKQYGPLVSVVPFDETYMCPDNECERFSARYPIWATRYKT